MTATLVSSDRLQDFRGRHAGADILVCGCGPSLSSYRPIDGVVTIGVNDVGRLFDPTYLVVVNPRNQFREDRFRHVERSRAQALFTQLDLGPVDPTVVRFPLGTYGGTEVSEGVLHYTQNSPYVAVCLAAWMGARRIGLLGVDFTEHHFFGATGRHPLAAQLARIDAEYAALGEALRRRGIELLNLSPVSRLQGLPRAELHAFVHGAAPTPVAVQRRVFVVNYRFLSCGEVFAHGLRHAAQALGIAHAEAGWDDPQLPRRIAAFRPDLVLVVHGRKFAQRWGGQLRDWRTAVWLTDEPYEVDDTAAWSSRFDHVFANDRTTLDRHPNAHHVPMCFDPQVHRDDAGPRRHAVGFIGGANPTRERFLLPLAEAGLLSYVVGGPWRSPALRRLCIADNVPAEKTAELYRQTEIVVNVFRETHHFNARGTAAEAMNPRIYEALACGAAVLSERRAEVGEVFPELPQFDRPEELVDTVRRLLADRAALAELRRQCRERLAGHAYGDRLARMLALAGLPVEQGAATPPQQIAASAPAASIPATALLATAAAAAPATPSRPTRALPTVAARPHSVRAAPAARLEPLPFDAPPRRNLLYHVWPVRGGTWRWNLQEMLKRVDLFNGRRIIGIVSDERAEPHEAVQALLEGHGFDCVLEANDSRGEGVTFAAMLRQVASFDRNELSYYAHAKGVKYEPAFPPAVRRWAEVQYAVTLDDWAAVREQMQRHAMTGIFRKHGRFRNHHEVGDWHYSGTFFWMRHAHVFRRRWQEVPQFYGGVEAWPGTLFHRDETGCLLLDGLRELPYQDRFWSQRGDPAFRRWQQGLRPVAAPPDLAAPPAFEGHARPRLEQKPDEYAWWLDTLLAEQVRSVLFIGAGWGGEEWHLARRFHAAGREVAITTLAPTARREWHEAVADASARFGAGPTLVDEAPATADAVFIDGDHGYRACLRDVELARNLKPRLIALHDIVDSDWHAHNRCCVSRVWAGLRAGAGAEERAGRDWGGIGLLRLAAS